MEPRIDKAEFAVLARRCGAPLSNEEIDRLYEGFLLLQRILAELDRPADVRAEPALLFTPVGVP